MTFLKSRTGSTRVVGCPDVSATAPDGYTLPMRVDPNSTPPGAIWIPKITHYNASGNASSGINATAVNICQLTVPAQGVSGTVQLTARTMLVGTTAGDLFEINVDDGTSIFAGGRATTSTNTMCNDVTVVGFRTMTATDTFTFRVLVNRIGGSGTGASVTDYRYNSLYAVFYPD